MLNSVINDLMKIFKSGVSAVLPENLVRNSVKYNPVTQTLSILEDKFNLSNKNVFIVGAGKAVQNMAKETEKILGLKLNKGIVSIPVGNLDKTHKSDKIEYFEGAVNNLPDFQAESTAKKIKDLVIKLKKDDLLLVLISGGGSALLPLPKKPITLEEKTILIKKLANSGADISELNIVRKRISELKGGKLAMIAQPAQVISLILSDIVGDPLDLIASGPTIENKDEPNKTKAIIEKFSLTNDLPDSIYKKIYENEVIEKFPKDNVKNYVIGSNKLSIKIALDKAKELQYLPIQLSNTVTGNVNDIAKKYASLTKIFCDIISGNLNTQDAIIQIQAANIPGIEESILDKIDLSNRCKGVCLILGGEITVEVRGSGKGGRNQHLALEYSKILNEMQENLKEFDIYLLSAGTDGIDGPTDAAGAIGYLDLVADAKKQNIDVQKYLNDNDTYNFYKKFENGHFHVVTGHTNTNVMDLHIILIKQKV